MRIIFYCIILVVSTGMTVLHTAPCRSGYAPYNTVRIPHFATKSKLGEATFKKLAGSDCGKLVVGMLQTKRSGLFVKCDK